MSDWSGNYCLSENFLITQYTNDLNHNNHKNADIYNNHSMIYTLIFYLITSSIIQCQYDMLLYVICYIKYNNLFVIFDVFYHISVMSIPNVVSIHVNKMSELRQYAVNIVEINNG